MFYKKEGKIYSKTKKTVKRRSKKVNKNENI